MKRDVLVISVALVLAALMISPVMGFTIKETESPYPFSIHAEARPQFTIATGTPAHNMTNSGVSIEKPARYSIQSGSPYQYSLQTGTPYQYTFIAGIPSAQVPVVEPEVTPEAITEEVAGAEVTENNASVPEVIEQPTEIVVPAATYLIGGVVFEDANGNAIKEDDELGLGGWDVDLSGAATMNTTTLEDGSYAFSNLNPGEYIVSLTVMPGYEVVAPQNVTITDAAVEVDFAVMKIPELVVPAEEAAPEIEGNDSESVSAPAGEIVSEPTGTLA